MEVERQSLQGPAGAVLRQVKKKIGKERRPSSRLSLLLFVGGDDQFLGVLLRGNKRLLRLCRLLLHQLFQCISDGVEEKEIRLFVDVHVAPPAYS